ncbi:hypothetical protein FACS1894172_20040 [Spirochaetia bacterium]|nr:hypothetical protein FACS1894172_20040 [Spirochaetia bacterium]
MLVMAGSLLDTAKKELTLEEFEAWRRELILKGRAGEGVTFTEEELDLFDECKEKFEGKLKRNADIV